MQHNSLLTITKDAIRFSFVRNNAMTLGCHNKAVGLVQIDVVFQVGSMLFVLLFTWLISQS